MKRKEIKIDIISQFNYKDTADNERAEGVLWWMIVKLYNLGLTKFNRPRQIRRFMKKHKVEFKHDYILNTISLYVDGEFKERFDGGYKYGIK